MTEKQVILFRTVAGSRLYGLDHAESDYDSLTVVAKTLTRDMYTEKYGTSVQTITGDQDVRIKDFGTWTRECEAGSPQALEAMFAANPEVDLIPAYRASYRAGINFRKRYRRLIDSLAVSPVYKHRQHAVRLAMNAQEMRLTDRFHPELSSTDVWWVKFIAMNFFGDELVKYLDDLAWVSSDVSERKYSA